MGKPKFFVKKFVYKCDKTFQYKKTIPNRVVSWECLSYTYNELFPESEFFDQLAITQEVVLTQVGEQSLSFTH